MNSRPRHKKSTGTAPARRPALAALFAVLLTAALWGMPGDTRASHIFDMFDQATNTALGSIEVDTAGIFFGSNIINFSFTDPVFGVVFDTTTSSIGAFGFIDDVLETIEINLTATTFANFDILEFNLPDPNEAEWRVFPDSGGFAQGTVLFVPQAVTTPATVALLALGLAGFGLRGRRPGGPAR